MLYAFLKRFIGLCVTTFYRLSNLGGTVPADGPIILVANHPNALVDPMLVGFISPRPVRFLGKAPLFKVPIIGSIMRAVGSLPVYRVQDSPGEQDKNEQTFAACFEAMKLGHAICIFPEGVSHSIPHIQRLKTGAARIALGAESQNGFSLGVRIVPVGLTYRNKHRFRGQCATEVGPAIPVADLKELYAQDPRKAAEELTNRISDALAKLTLNVEKWEDMPALEAAEMIYASARKLSTAQVDREARLRRFAEGLRIMRQLDPDRVEKVRGRIASFSERMAKLGADPADLDARYPPGVVVKYFFTNLFALFIGLPLATLGAAFFYIPYQVPRLVVTVFEPPLDIVASAKIGTILVVFPAWYALVVAAGGYFGGLEWGLGLAVAMPLCGFYAIRFLERREENLEDAAIFFRLGLRGARKHRLLARRAQLAEEIEQLIDKLDELNKLPEGAAPPRRRSGESDEAAETEKGAA